MQKFLDQVAQHIFEHYPDRFDRICLVTPNRRSGLFLKTCIAQRITKASWAPEVQAFEDLVKQITGLTICDNTTLLLEFHQAYTLLEGDKAEPLEEFLKWAQVLLRDFNDVEAGMHQPEELFDYLLDVKYIESWNPDGSPLTDFQKKYLAFFSHIKGYHKHLNEHLLQKNMAYQGLAYSRAAKLLPEMMDAMGWEKIIFAGFNALNLAEETIIKTLVKAAKAETIWDADFYYTHNKSHEAGHFIRKYAARLSGKENFSFLGDHFSHSEKNIHIYGVAKNINQAKLAGSILQKLPQAELNSTDTALVMANENLLIPVMNSLPDTLERVNVTLGYPLVKTNIYSLFTYFFQLHLTTLRMGTARTDGKTAFYHKDLIRFFSHPCTAIYWHPHEGTSYCSMLTQRIAKSNAIFQTLESMEKHLPEKLAFRSNFGMLLKAFACSLAEIPDTLLSLCDKLSQAFLDKAAREQTPIEQSNSFLDYEALYYLSNIIRKLKAYQETQQGITNLKTFYMLFQALARESRLAFSGEPLNGLQIMGVLETRNLDFKNLILLSVNEDILPAAKTSNSFIPFDVKTKYEIPVYREKDAVFAYHFYRLLQRAENIHLVYNTQSQDVGNREKSRFITQLLMEMPSYNSRIQFHETIIALPPASDSLQHEIGIRKTPDIREKLIQKSQEGFSPSALITYINCSLQFYFRYIAGLREAEEVEETIEANTLGTVIHAILEALYDPYKGKVLRTEDIASMIPQVESLTLQMFEQHYPGGEIHKGKNLLLTRMAMRYTRNFLQTEKDFIERLQKDQQYLTYLNSEERLEASLDIVVNDQVWAINFKGTADRVDKIDSHIRIIDYKTGKVENKELNIKQWEDLTNTKKLSKSFQLLMYGFLYQQTHPEYPAFFEPGIISFRNVNKGLLTLNVPEKGSMIDHEVIELFTTELQRLMEDIFNENIPFRRTEDEENCRFCPFKTACHRTNTKKLF